MSEHGNKKLAVLIDADNAQASTCPELLAEIAKFGDASGKGAYGNRTTTNLKGWKEHLHKHASLLNHTSSPSSSSVTFKTLME